MNNALSIFTSNPLESQLAKAELLIKSGMVPATFKTPEAVLVACTIGHELGFSPIQSLNVINVIEGKPTLGLNGYLALIAAHNGSVDVVSHTETECTVKVNRNGRSHTESYTIAEAAKAGLAGKGNWVKMPKKMLFARAVTAATRIIFADVVSGLYETDEIKDFSNNPESIEAPTPSKTRSKAPKSNDSGSETLGLAKPVKSAPSAIIDIPVEIPEETFEPEVVATLDALINPSSFADFNFALITYERVNGHELAEGRHAGFAKWLTDNKTTFADLEAKLIEKNNKSAG